MKLTAMIALALLAAACGGGDKKPQTTPVTTEPTPPPESKPAVAEAKPPEAPPAPAAGKSLFDRLGGMPAITAVVEEFVARTTTDPRIKERFFNVDAAALKKNLADFVCVATGGTCKYAGRDMTTTHAGMELVEEEFNALVENLAGALDKFKVPAKEKGELLGALGPLKPQIVAPADKLKPIDDKELATVTKLQGTLKQKDAADLLGLAVTAGKRGQRSFAEQLFTRAEMLTGPKPLAGVAKVFRAGAPTRVTTATKKAEDKPQPPVLKEQSEEDKMPAKAKIGTLAGSLKIAGKAPTGLGVIMLTPVKGGGKKRAPKPHTIEQRNKEFAPHVMAIPVGSTVSFPNFDQIFHNVFSISKTKAFDLGMYKSGETREMKFDKPGIVRLGCNLHAAMSAYLIVVAAPHYAVIDKDGTFSFKSLAPGKYKVEVWNESAGDPMTEEVEVKEGENAKDFDLKAAPAGISPNKFGEQR